MNKPRVVLDTNVLISAILCGGNPAEYFSLALADLIELYVSPFILEELSRILQKKFHWETSKIDHIKRWYLTLARSVEPSEHVSIIKRQDSDNRILECSLAAKAHYLVTGDKRDILPLGEFRGIRIVSPIEGLSLMTPSYSTR